MDKIKVLVTSVGAPPGRNVVKALSEREDIAIIAVDMDPLVPLLYDPEEIAGSYVVPRASEEAAYIKELTSIASKENIDIIIPCLGKELLVLARYKDHFSKISATVLCPEHERIMRVIDKHDLMELARKAGIPVPQTRLLKDFVKNPANMKYPVIAKPRIGAGARGIFIIRDEHDLKKAYSAMQQNDHESIVQEYIPGEAGSIFLCGLLYDKNGKVMTEFLSRSIKTMFDFGGPAVCGEPVKGFDRLKHYSKALMDEAGGWYGPVNIEYKVSSEDGLPYILEANPRFWGYGLLAVKSGIDFPYAAVMEAMGRKPVPAQDYNEDVVLMRETRDTVIPRSLIKKNGGDKVICVYEVRSGNRDIAGNINELLKISSLKGIVLTGEKGSLQPFQEQISGNDRLYSYVMQAGDGKENLYEIGLYNSADVMIRLKNTDEGVRADQIEEGLKAFLEDGKEKSCLDRGNFQIMTSDHLKTYIG